MSDHALDTPVFQIGFNRCGTKFLADIFRQNGYSAAHWQRGALAENILFAKHAGTLPLGGIKPAHFFGDMECCHRFDKPLLEAFREFEFLDQAFPKAYFILNLRDPSAWIASRCAHHDARYIQFHSHHLNLPVADVPAYWLADWHAHIDAVRRYFKGHSKFIEYNIDTDTPEMLGEFLRADYRLEQFPSPNAAQMAQRRTQNKVALAQIRAAPKPSPPDQDSRPKPRSESADKTWVADMITHCLGARQTAQPAAKNLASGLFGHWDGDKTVLKKNGTSWGFVRARLGPSDAFLTSETQPKIDRLQGVLNSVLRLGRACDLAVDMQDARNFGHLDKPNPSTPLLTYNRRAGAKNVVLWPLAGYHDIGLETFTHAQSPDTLRFEQKDDVVAWRGNLTGRAGFHQGHSDWRPSHQILYELSDSEIDPQTERKLTQELNALPRFEFMMRHHLLADFNLAFTLPHKFKALKGPDKLGIFCGARKPVSWFYQFKYLVCLSGFDTGSNFFVAANSNSVVFKEEDGWELFYTAQFRAWEHYIPIKVGGVDMQEKLDWARSHPDECKAMSKACQSVCARLADPVLRAQMLNGVLDGVLA